MADGDPDAVLSDVDDDPSPVLIRASPSLEPSPPPPDPRVQDLVAELDRERQARKAADSSFARIKVLIHEAIRKRDDANRDRDEAARQRDEAARQRDEALSQRDEALSQRDEALSQRDEALSQKDEISRQKDEISRQKDALRAEIEAAAQMLVTGIDKISGKVRNFKNFSAGGLPRSDKYKGLPAVAYGVLKRTNEIVEEISTQAEAAGKARDQAREQVEQKNYEVAIELSQLEAAVAGLREDVKRLEMDLGERNGRVLELEAQLRESDEKSNALQGKLDAQSKLVIDQLGYISRVHDIICEIVKNVDSGQSDLTESTFMWKEMDMDENLRTSLEGMASLCEFAKLAAEKVKEKMDGRVREVEVLNETVARLMGEKKHIGTLLRSALTSKASNVRQVAEDGLKEAGIDFKFDGNGSTEEVDEVYTLAGALENTVKTAQVKILDLQSLVEALRAESSLRKAHLDAQEKEINHLKHCIKELEQRERIANENVEGLMTDIAAAEEEIARWKNAAEEEAAAGRAVEEDFMAQLSSIRRELEEAKQAVMESENKLKFKEETAAAAMAARDAAEKSLKLADLRSARLRERLEELNRQLEESDNRNDSSLNGRPRYVCWPWQWLGLNFVRYQPDIEVASNEMELSEPLV